MHNILWLFSVANTQHEELAICYVHTWSLYIVRTLPSAQPEGKRFGQATVQDVELPLSEQQRTILLACDIEPGVLRQSYTAIWLQLSPGPPHEIRNVTFSPTFDLMLNVTRSMNDFQYQCQVKINHNSSISRMYNGTIITLNIYNVLSKLCI